MPGKFVYDHSRPMASADTVLFAVEDAGLMALLVRRGKDPFKGKWALPGGFIEIDEDVRVAAERELFEETGVKAPGASFLGLYAKPGRDPRGRMLTAVFYACARAGAIEPRAGDDAQDAQWHSALKPPALAFDHAQIIADAVERLRAETVASDAAFRFLGPCFSEGELRAVFEAILGKKIPLGRFLEIMDSAGVLKPAAGGQVRLCRKTMARLQRGARLFGF